MRSMLSVRVVPSQASRVEDFYGRLYHDEHFAHGMLLAQGDAGPELTRKVTAGLNGGANGVAMHAHTKDFNRAVTGQGSNAITLGTPVSSAAGPRARPVSP